MQSELTKRYQKPPRLPLARVVTLMPLDEADAIDKWGVPAGMPNRTSAVRFLLKKGLEAVQAQEEPAVAG